jgi:hypothetical protein
LHHGAAERMNGREDAEELLYRVRHQVRRFGKPAPLLGITRQPDEAGPHAGLRRVHVADHQPDVGFDFPAIELAPIDRRIEQMGDRPAR